MRSVQVVVVHGIGSQKVGQMASRWSEALVRFAGASGLRAVVRDAQLVDDPATVRIEIGAHGAEPSYELCVREAYWANAFAEPSVGRVLRFLLTIAPALAITQTILIWQERKAIWGPQRRNWVVPAIVRTTTVVAPLALAMAALGLAAPLIAVLLLALLLVASVPIPAVKQRVGKLLGWLTTSIGDSYLFVADPVSRAAMQARVAACLSVHAEERAGSTVVLAHSQGAAVAYRALLELPSDRRPVAFITVGSGIGRLDDVSRLRDLPRWLTPLFVLVALLGTAAVVVRPLWWTWVLGPAALVAVLVTWWYCGRWLAQERRLQEEAGEAAESGGPQEEGAEEDADEQDLALGGVSWLDIWAFLDVVPNGRPVRAATGDPTYEAHRVAGELSLVRDHLRYERDWGQTLPLVFARLCDPDGEEPVGYRGVRPGPGPLAHQDLVGGILRAVPLVATLWLACTLDLFAIGLWLRTAPPAVLEGVAETVVAPIEGVTDFLHGTWRYSPAAESLLGALFLGLLGLLGAVATRRVLSFWQDRETRAWLRDEPWTTHPTPPWWRDKWLFALTPVVVTALAVPALLVWQQGRPLWTAHHAVEAYLEAVARNDMRALCAVTTRDIVELGMADGACDASEPTGLVPICSDAQEAVSALHEGSFEVRGSTVEVTVAPETYPHCENVESGTVYLPAGVRLSEGQWRVSAVTGPPGPGGCPSGGRPK